ncbi:cytochrome P450 [Xylogone sp. PMI_703]|nr:cytochrome P450 [Xylogone sp. PMI_703]
MDGVLEIMSRPSYLGLLGVLTVLTISGLLRRFLRKHSRMPVLGSPKDSNFLAAIQEGYEKYTDSPFLIPLPGQPLVVLPRHYADEVKALSDSQINFTGDLQRRFHSQYTFVAAADHSMLLHTINLCLTRDVPRVLRLMQDEIQYVDRTLIGDCQEWKSFLAKDFSLDLVATLSARVFIDIPEISRSKEWLECTTQYPLDSMAGEQKLKKYPRWTLPLLHHFIPEVQRVMGYKKHFKKVLKPLLEERLKNMQDPDFKRPNDVLQTIIDNPNGKGLDLEMHALLQLDLAQAAILNSANSLHQILLDVAARPELVPALREEIFEAMLKEGGVLTKNNIGALWKLDSFMKECQRYTPPGIISHTRVVMQPLKLSNNVQLYPDEMIAIANYAINKDPRVYENPDTFDAERFVKLRSQPGNANRYQYTSNSVTALDFGYGRHPCPGRFFVSTEIKAVLAHLLLHYDIKLDGTEERPPNLYRGVLIIPNPESRILLRKRTV